MFADDHEYLAVTTDNMYSSWSSMFSEQAMVDYTTPEWELMTPEVTTPEVTSAGNIPDRQSDLEANGMTHTPTHTYTSTHMHTHTEFIKHPRLQGYLDRCRRLESVLTRGKIKNGKDQRT